MPTTFIGLLIFVVFLTPGLMHTRQARVLVPYRDESALVETASIVSVSLVANLVTVVVAAGFRWWQPTHTPDVGRMVALDSTYVRDHSAYVATWTIALLVMSCVIAVWLARVPALRRIVTANFSPVITDASAWSEVFNTTKGRYTYAGCELKNGSYVGGRITWFSTELEETGDRELCLGPPITFRSAEGGHGDIDAQRVVLAAREIHRIDVSYIEEPQDVATRSWLRRAWRRTTGLNAEDG